MKALFSRVAGHLVAAAEPGVLWHGLRVCTPGRLPGILGSLALAAIGACPAPFLLNLGGEPLTAEIVAATRDRRVA
jgi:hypothetical protein